MEVTRIVTIQLTGIFNTEDYEGGAEEAAKKLADGIKEMLCLDDVQVLDAKDFVREISADGSSACVQK